MASRPWLLFVAVLLVSFNVVFGQGTGGDWQYFNVFNIVKGPNYPTSNIPGNYDTDFDPVRTFTPARGWTWSTFEQIINPYLVPVYGVPGLDSGTVRDEKIIDMRTDRALMRIDALATSREKYIAAITLTLWGSRDFDPNHDLAPLSPDTARVKFGVSPAVEDYYTGVQFYRDQDYGVPLDPRCDIFDSEDIAGLPERLAVDTVIYNIDTDGDGTPDITWTFQPVTKWVQVGTETFGNSSTTPPTPSRTWKKWQATFAFRNAILIPTDDVWGYPTSKTLPFKRFWVAFRSLGCHDCDTTTPGTRDSCGIEGLSILDTFFVGIDTFTDIYAFFVEAGVRRLTNAPMGNVEVKPDTTAPTNLQASRWYKSEWIIGQDSIPPLFQDLYPHNVVASNGAHSDVADVDGDGSDSYSYITPGTTKEWNSAPSSSYPTPNDWYIYTADPVQLISFVVKDRATCVDSVIVEIRYLNGSGFACRYDSIFFRNHMSRSYDNQNGWRGVGWSIYIKEMGNHYPCSTPYPYATHGPYANRTQCSEAGVVPTIRNQCGADSFFVAVGCNTIQNDLDGFIDGAWVKVTVRAYNRNDHFFPWEYASWAETSWVFVVDLAGPNAELICPLNEYSMDGDATRLGFTREFFNYGGADNYNRFDIIEGVQVPYAFLADSLPMFHIHVTDRYEDVSQSTYPGGVGGSGFNLRDFTFMFIIRRNGSGGCPPREVDTLLVTEEDLEPFTYCGQQVQGCYYDESNDGREGEIYIPFEYLYNSPRDDARLFRINSGDVVYLLATEMYDDPDYGQNETWIDTNNSCAYQEYIDLYPSNSYCSAGGPDPNYGTKSGNDTPIVDGAVIVAGCAGYTTSSPDTLGIVRIDLVGPKAPDSLYYPPHGWVTSDTFQVITVDIFDQVDRDTLIGGQQYVCADTAYSSNYMRYGVAGVRTDSLIMNIKVQGCDGSWHPYYRGPEGRNFRVRYDNCSPHPHPYTITGFGDTALIAQKIRFHNPQGKEWWGTRVVFDPYATLNTATMRREGKFRPGDKVCVTLYACDNASVPCQAMCGGYLAPCPTVFDGCTITGYWYDGTVKTRFPFSHYVPGMNWAQDVIDPEDHTYINRAVARFNFYVDDEEPVVVVESVETCPFEWKFYLHDVSDNHIGPWCDQWVAGVGALDIRLVTVDDEPCPGGTTKCSDTIFINDLPYILPAGVTQVIYHDGDTNGYWTAYYSGGLDSCHYLPCCDEPNRAGRYLYVSLTPDPNRLNDPRYALLTLYNGNPADPMACYFFEPDDSIRIQIYAGDRPNVPWFPATARPRDWKGPYAGGGPDSVFAWFHDEDCYTDPLHSGDPLGCYGPYVDWRCDIGVYDSLATAQFDRGLNSQNFTDNGYTYYSHEFCDWENPNWGYIYKRWLTPQSNVSMVEARWFNPSAFTSWDNPGFTAFTYPPDLSGVYRNLWEVPPTGSAMSFNTTNDDVVLGSFARDLDFIVARFQTCTDSIIWECRSGTHPPEDSVVNHAPYAHLKLYNASGTLIWEKEGWYDCHCEPCWLNYRPDRIGCMDAGELIVGPIYQLGRVDTLWDSVFSYNAATGTRTFRRRIARTVFGWPFVRSVAYTESWTYPDTVILVASATHGYLNGDRLVVEVGIYTRNPNQFGHDNLGNYHFYRWQYNIDMQAPTANFVSLVAGTGYEEVNCVGRHATNHEIRVRLESILDGAGVGCSGGDEDPGYVDYTEWTNVWPLPAVVPGTDMLRYVSTAVINPALDETLNLVYNPGTYWLYTNEHKVIHNCADEAIMAVSNNLATPITIYHGVQAGAPIEETFTRDTIFVADSFYAEAQIQDRLGNTAYVRSRRMALDNGLPRVKGFCFASAIRDTLGNIIGFDNWDDSKFLLPWNVPDQDSLVGVYFFGPAVCTVYVRIWFSDNMDMRNIDPVEGHIVRFRPQGWTHWFPVMPIPAHAGFYPLSNRYADYSRVENGPTAKAVVPGTTDVSAPVEISDIEPGWNSDREWIGFFVVADSIMDGIATLRVQGFDDNAGNVMLDHEYAFRIETRRTPPAIAWPIPEFSDNTENDTWELPYGGGRQTVTAYDDVTSYLGDCGLFTQHGECIPIQGYGFDPTITDSVVFLVYLSNTEITDLSAASLTQRYGIDDMLSPLITYNAVYNTWVAEMPCAVFNLLNSVSAGQERYAAVEFRAYSRFYGDTFLSDTLLNIYIDNRDLCVVEASLHLSENSDIPPDPTGTDTLLVPITTTSLDIILTGDEITGVDYIGFYLEDQLTGNTLPIFPDVTPPYDDSLYRISNVPGPNPYYDAASNSIVYTWQTAGELQPGLWILHIITANEIQIAHGFTSVTYYTTYYHQCCLTRQNIFVPREAFLARGDEFVDAMDKTGCIYTAYPPSVIPSDIYPWVGEDLYPDWPGWVHVDAEIVDGYEYMTRFQATTYNNPDYTSGDPDPLRHPFVEQGGYPGDSIYVLFEVFPTGVDALTDSIIMVIEDEFGGWISGSNPTVRRKFRIPDDLISFTDCLGDTHYYIRYNWVLDDQENRYDGVVRISMIVWQHPAGSPSVGVSSIHNTFVLLDTYDPLYRVNLVREDGSPMMICRNDAMPLETIWVANADTVWIRAYWLQTLFDQAPTAEGYISYDSVASTRLWEFLRMSIDGQPHYGELRVDDPNDMLETRLWHSDRTDIDFSTGRQFWHQPNGGYDAYADPFGYFEHNLYTYRWAISNNPNGNGLAVIMIKGRDCAGNILDYEEARNSDAFGKYVLIDTQDPTVYPDRITITTASVEGAAGSIGDNFINAGYYSVEPEIYGSYVYIVIYDDASTEPPLTGRIRVNADGSISEVAVDLSSVTDDTVLVCATDLAGNTTCVTMPVAPPIECCTWDFCAGWNLVSLSVLPDDLTITSLFDGMSVYINRNSSWIPVTSLGWTELRAGDGYFVTSPTAQTWEICGEPVFSYTLTDLQPGWNSIGSIWGGVNLSITPFDTDPANAINTAQGIYEYNCVNGTWPRVTDNILDQCVGYLVYANVACTLNVPGGGRSVTPAKEREIVPLWNATLKVSSKEASRDLTIGVAEGATPLADGSFDVAILPGVPGTKNIYLDNYLAVNFTSIDRPVWKLSSDVDFTLTTSITNVPADYDLYIDVKEGLLNLREIDGLELPAGEYTIVAYKRVVPTTYAVNQNFPNPFNAATAISYAIPERADVVIEVYDLTGHKVRTLVNDRQDAGFHTVIWDGTDDDGKPVVSGVYLYRIKAGSYAESKQMILSK